MQKIRGHRMFEVDKLRRECPFNMTNVLLYTYEKRSILEDMKSNSKDKCEVKAT